MLGMATDPRQGFDPNDSLMDVSASFEALAALFQLQIDGLEAQPAPDAEAISHLKNARKAALHGAGLVEAANGDFD
jgi:hypothetical protein